MAQCEEDADPLHASQQQPSPSPQALPFVIAIGPSITRVPPASSQPTPPRTPRAGITITYTSPAKPPATPTPSNPPSSSHPPKRASKFEHAQPLRIAISHSTANTSFATKATKPNQYLVNIVKNGKVLAVEDSKLQKSPKKCDANVVKDVSPERIKVVKVYNRPVNVELRADSDEEEVICAKPRIAMQPFKNARDEETREMSFSAVELQADRLHAEEVKRIWMNGNRGGSSVKEKIIDIGMWRIGSSMHESNNI